MEGSASAYSNILAVKEGAEKTDKIKALIEGNGGKITKEANEGKGLKVAKWLRPYMTYVLPVIVFVIFAVGIYNFFAG